MGSIRLRRKPDTWELRVYLGRDENNKVHHKHVTFIGSKRDAEKELTRLSYELESKPRPSVETGIRWNSKTTFNDAILAWKENGWQDLSPKTVRNYEGCYKRYIEASIGKNAVAATGVFEIESYFRSLADDGLGLATIKYIRAVLLKAARLAGKWSGGVIPNPVALADLPKFSPRTAVRAASVDEVKLIIEKLNARGDLRLSNLIRLLAATGMRRGEAVALRWSDISFENSVVKIDKAAIMAKGSLILKSPKTTVSNRTVAIDSSTLTSLSDLKLQQQNFAKSMEISFTDSNFVFSYFPDGSVPPHPDTVSHQFKKAAIECGIFDIHLHSLRHFQATVIDPIVSERQKQARLGWSTSHMARHYTDPISDEDRKVADEVGRLLDS